MPVIIVGAERTLAALRPRIAGGRVSTAAARALDDAVKAANPGTDFSNLEPGTVVSVPDDVPKVAVRGELSVDDGSKQAVAALVESAGGTLEQLATTAKGLEREDTAERRRLAKALEAKELDAAGRKDKAVAAAVKAAREAVAAEDEAARARAAALDEARKEWSAELKALQKLVP